MSSLLSVPIAAALVVLAVAPASACQPRSEAMPSPDQTADSRVPIGLWDIRPAEAGVPGLCRLALRGEAEDDGHRIVLENCDLKAARQAHHWRTTPGGFVLADAAGVTLMTFTVDTVDSWTGTDADGRHYRMDRTAMF